MPPQLNNLVQEPEPIDDQTNEVKLVHHFVEDQAYKTPNHVAVKDSSQTISYEELNSRANRLANYLISLGVGNGQLVGLSVDRTVDLVVSVLAILKAGAAYLPLDPSYPQDRLSYMLKNASASVIITDDKGHGKTSSPLTQDVEHVVNLDTKRSQIALHSPETPRKAVMLDDSLAYVIYTSGSTGKPKGVALPHRSLVNLIRWQIDESIVTTGPTLQYTPISFDVSFQEIFSTLGVGGTLIMIEDETRRDPYGLLKVLEEASVERLFLPFVALQYLAEAAVTAAAAGAPKLKLKEVITAGEQLRVTPALVNWFEQMPNCSLYNHYGPSESHVVTSYRLQGVPNTWPLLPPIGRSLPHAQIYLLDQELRPVADGQTGEIYIGGECLAREYLHRPDLTAERFIPTPSWLVNSTDRLYKTGDLARCLPDGDFEFLGRSDQQIKIRGYRIEPGEVEAALEEHSMVSEAVVVARSGRPGQKQLVAYVTTQLHQNDASAFQQYLQDRLPAYMVPSAIVCLEVFPLTPSGKVDRTSLPAPEQAMTSPRTLPKTDLEQKLAQIWVDVLGVKWVGLEDDFFGLGGDSLLATLVITRIRESIKREISLREFFEAPQLASLATLLSTKTLPSSSSEMLPLKQGSRPAQLPPSWMQEPLWFLDQLMAGNPFYNVPEAFQMEGPLSVPALTRSLQTVVDRHETLRTTFEEVHGKPVQIIHKEAVCPVSITDLSALPEAERELEVQKMLVEAARSPFDLSSDVLLRASIFKVGGSRHILLLNLHHIVCDGWSVSVLMQDLQKLYTAYVAGEPSPLAPLPVQYADFTVWQRQTLSKDQHHQQLAYWREQLGGTVPKLELPFDFPRPTMPSYTGGREFLTLSKDLTQALKDLAKTSGTTLFMVLLASFQTLLYRYTGQDDIAIGTTLANRPHPDLENLIGFFPNTLVMRSDLSGTPSFREVLNRIREVAMGAYANQDLSFEHLVHALHPNHAVGENPFFHVLFNLQNTPAGTWDQCDVSMEHLNLSNGTTKFDLFLELTEIPEGMTGYLEYSADLFKPETIARMGTHLMALLESIVADHNLTIGKLSISSTTELQQLADWNNTTMPYPKHLCLHQLIEEQVGREPTAAALQFGEKSLTYDELNQRANQCAHYMRQVGLVPGERVGILMERSLDLLTSMLAVMKAGGTYVPLDPIYPPQRLVYMMEDSGLTVLLTERKIAAKVPETEAKIVYLDEDWSHIAQQSKANLVPTSESEDLLYILYTSGSTGKPKGVQIQHQSVNNLLWSFREKPGITAKDTMLALTTVCFDIAVIELWLPLIVGAKVVMAPREVAQNPHELARVLHDETVTVAQATPSAWRILVASGWHGNQGLKVLSGGEPISRELADQLLDRCDSLWNVYGPTETTVWSTVCRLTKGESAVPIGRPIANTKLYVVNSARDNGGITLQQVPLGAVGELYIGGDGLARGYLNRPDTTKEKFIPNPFDEDPNSLIYCTGDLARYLPDGTLECLGRTDHQIKIRGFRIELGDIESTLRQQQGVKAAVVVAREIPSGDKQLAAYIITDVDEEAQSKVQAQQWGAIWDEAYRQTSDECDLTFNINGWIDSYTGLPTPVEEMSEWVDHTIDRIMALHPRRLFEIGCGTGLLLYRLTPQCEAYRAIDVSEEAIHLIQQNLTKNHSDWDVDIETGAAHGLTAEKLEHIDTVVINSVAQYFPNIDYFVDVVTKLVEGLKPGSRVFLGDLRSLSLLTAFHTGIQLYQADKSTTIEQLQARIQERLTQESELLIAPDIFTELQQSTSSIEKVEVQLKRGRHHNELTRFRYDVVLHIGPGHSSLPPAMPPSRQRWQPSVTLIELEKYLSANQDPCLQIQAIPNARLVHTIAAMKLLQESPMYLQTVADLKEAVQSRASKPSIDPEDLYQLGDRLGYNVQITEADSADSDIFDVLFQRPEISTECNVLSADPMRHQVEQPTANWEAYANRPSTGVSPTKKVLPDLRKALQEQLPEYMVPSTFTVLSEFPLTPNGKVDRQALPDPTPVHRDGSDDDTMAAPRNPVETKIAQVWGDVLSLEKVGIDENFFELGGHSMLAAELMFRLKEEFDVALQLVDIFTSPTVAEQAQLISDQHAEVHATGAAAKPEAATATLDLWAEALLAEDIYAQPDMSTGDYTNPDAVLLTGATGFLGAYLLDEILKQTDADIYCLVRAENEVKARQRIQTNLEAYDLWPSPLDQARIIPIVGDLSKPHLAISDEKFQFLSETIDIIYHNGAMVNFLHPYKHMKPTNVTATEIILRLASQKKLKSVHFVSTMGVFSPLDYPKHPLQNEKVFVTEHDGQSKRYDGLYGYTQSKWVAEKLCTIASENRNIPTSIYRPSWVEGHSETGQCNNSDFLRSMIKGCLQLGVAPDWDMPIDIVPVDYFSQAIVSLSLTNGNNEQGKNNQQHLSYNFVNPNGMMWNQLVDWLTATYGYNHLQRISYAKWIELIKVQVLPGSNNALLPFLSFLTNKVATTVVTQQQQQQQQMLTIPEMYFRSSRLEFDTSYMQERLLTNHWNGMVQSSVYPSVVSLLPVYFNYFIQSNYIDAPPQYHPITSPINNKKRNNIVSIDDVFFISPTGVVNTIPATTTKKATINDGGRRRGQSPSDVHSLYIDQDDLLADD